MRVRWRLPLSVEPDDDAPSDHTGPIHVAGREVLFAESVFTHNRATRGRDSTKRGLTLSVHRVDLDTGDSTVWRNDELRLQEIEEGWAIIPGPPEDLLFTGHLHVLTPSPTQLDLPAFAPREGVLPHFLTLDGTLIYADQRRSELVFFDRHKRQVARRIDLKNSGPYKVGPARFIGDQLFCFGNNRMNAFSPDGSELLATHVLSRIDKLYPPAKIGDDTLWGYTNWSSGGVVRVSCNGEILWKYSRKFQGPSDYCELLIFPDVVVWPKNDTEFVGVHLSTGEELWRLPAPWIYARAVPLDGAFVFGSSGHIWVVDARTGKPRWRQAINGGGTSFVIVEGSVLVGDHLGRVLRFSLLDGSLMDEIQLGAPVVGKIVSDGTSVLSRTSSHDAKAPELFCVEL